MHKYVVLSDVALNVDCEILHKLMQLYVHVGVNESDASICKIQGYTVSTEITKYTTLFWNIYI